ncbi:MAG: hypothetical protein IAF08_06970 [Rhizobacter sp.]|nr:hypothetical protein [Chlorobiales bacterium]
MKKVFLIAALLVTSAASDVFSQAAAIGEVSYLEGQVKVQKGAEWTAVQLKQPLFADQTIQTGSDATVEIKWTNGAKTTVEAGNKQSLASLYENSGKAVKSETQGVWASFLQLFKSKSNTKQEEGGIRRSMASVRAQPGRDELYWKADEEVAFEDASKLYDAKNYAKAVRGFGLFIEQKPKDARVKLATFAMGHCYIELNNAPKAKEVFQAFAAKYPGDELAEEARKVLAKL